MANKIRIHYLRGKVNLIALGTNERTIRINNFMAHGFSQILHFPVKPYKFAL